MSSAAAGTQHKFWSDYWCRLKIITLYSTSVTWLCYDMIGQLNMQWTAAVVGLVGNTWPKILKKLKHKCRWAIRNVIVKIAFGCHVKCYVNNIFVCSLYETCQNLMFSIRVIWTEQDVCRLLNLSLRNGFFSSLNSYFDALIGDVTWLSLYWCVG